MPEELRALAGASVRSNQEMSALQQALLDSVKFFTRDVLRFSHDWQVRWTDPVMTQELAEIGEALLVALSGLESELSRLAGPSQPQVAGFLGTLLGTPETPGPLDRLRALTGSDPAAMSLEDQRLLSEADTLFIQLNGLRAQWQDYLSLATALGRANAQRWAGAALPPLPPNRKSPRASDPTGPMRRLSTAKSEPTRPEPAPAGAAPSSSGGLLASFWLGDGLWSGLVGVLKALMPFLLALVVVAFLAYGVISRLPKPEHQAAPVSVTNAPVFHTPQATTTSLPISTSITTPSATVTAQPSPISPPAGASQLSANPLALALPCPGSGAASLQVANTGATSLDWQATVAGASGGEAGILLDGAASENGQLKPGESTQISVTALTTNAQGTITLTAAGVNPVTVSYSVTC